ncbi:MAG: ABC transporter ATP-binding protein [Candidatus Omnitrophica bacterium]|nr:ABC transporter ATP-binding protein [Candidatus Omnitrophota bacterium]
MPALTLRNISKRFKTVQALEGINLSIEKGTFCVVLGPSGCGKSTLLNCVAGLEQPSSGSITLGGREITRLSPHKRNMAMVFQSYALYPHLTVFENIAFGLRARKESPRDIRQKVHAVSENLDIAAKLSSYPAQLSGGQRQRVALARAIVREPELFLFDEPLSNLDARLRMQMRAELLKLHQRIKKTMLYVTHDQTEALTLGDEVVLIKDGRIQQASSPRELYHHPRNLFVAEFIGTPPMNVVRKELLEEKGCLVFPGVNLPRFSFLGFRPSAARITSDGPLKGEVTLIETVGEDSYAFVRIAEKKEVCVKLTHTSLPRPRSVVSLSLDEHGIHLFDAQGEKIR